MHTMTRGKRIWDITTYAVLILLAVFCLAPIVRGFYVGAVPRTSSMRGTPMGRLSPDFLRMHKA